MLLYKELKTFFDILYVISQSILILSFFLLSPFFNNTVVSMSYEAFLYINIVNVPICLTLYYLNKRYLLEESLNSKKTFKKPDPTYFKKKPKSSRIFTEEDRTFSYEDIKKNQEEVKSDYSPKHEQNIHINKYQKEMDILNLKGNFEDLNKADLKKQFRKVAKAWHPDFGKTEYDIKLRTERMTQINESYHFLLSKIN